MIQITDVTAEAISSANEEMRKSSSNTGSSSADRNIQQESDDFRSRIQDDADRQSRDENKGSDSGDNSSQQQSGQNSNHGNSSSDGQPSQNAQATAAAETSATLKSGKNALKPGDKGSVQQELSDSILKFAKDMVKPADQSKDMGMQSSLSNSQPDQANAQGHLPGGLQNPSSSGDSILQSMFSQNADAAKQTETDNSLSNMAKAIADKILVSDKSSTGPQEVRIMLKEQIMKQTEIRISKTGEQVQVQLVTRSNDSYQLLATYQSDLQNFLKKNLDKEVSVELAFGDSGKEENQGRSRQQRNLYDEMDQA